MKSKTAVITRFHYPLNDPDFNWRLEYFRDNTLRALLEQTDQDFDIWVWCETWHFNLFRELHPRIQVFNVDYIYRRTGKHGQYFQDGSPWDKVHGLPYYELQIAVDSDDLLEPEGVATIKAAVAGKTQRTCVSVQPLKLDIKTGKKYQMRGYPGHRASPCYAIYQPTTLTDNFMFLYHDSHMKIAAYCDQKVELPEGLVLMSIHDRNDSTGIDLATDREIGSPQKTIRLNIFSNATNDAPSLDVIERTWQSFVDTFGYVPMTIYVDPHPNFAAYNAYRRALTERFGCEVVQTTGLAEGFVQSIETSTEDYLFQLEHDWVFDQEKIQHSLPQILDVMAAEDLFYMRFNRFPNTWTEREAKWQSFVDEKHSDAGTGMNYCVTDNLSNNPHILNRKYYLDNFVKLIDRTLPGAGLVEEVLTRKGFTGALYGGLNYPATVIHTDGRKGGAK